MMNEKVLELAKQSGLIQYESDGKLMDVEIFANLLIQRFIHLIGDQELSFHYLDEPEGVDAMRVLKNYVREYFEVPYE